MNTVILKNGAEEAKGLVTVIMMSLRSLIESKPIVFYELVELCKDPTHELWGDSINDLKELNLIELSGTIHSSIKHVVLSATAGDGMDLMLGSPIK